MSTVLDSQTDKSVITRILMTLKSPVYENKVLAVVEGNDDTKVFRKFFNLNVVDVIAVEGKERIKGLFSTVDPKYSGRLFAIKDADFDHIIGHEYDYSNLFRTDFHDLEIMMMTDDFYDALIAECLEGNKGKLTDLKDVHSEISIISWLKLTCIKLNKAIDFKTCTLSKCHYSGNNSINYDDCYNALIIKPLNNSIGIPTEEEINSTKDEFPYATLNQINNGHDICAGLIQKCKFLLNNRDVLSKDVLAAILRTSYTFSSFEKTQLYKDLSIWASGKTLKIFN